MKKTSRFLLAVFFVALCLALSRCGTDWCVAGIGPCKNIPSFDPNSHSGGGSGGLSATASPSSVSVSATNRTSTITASGGVGTYHWTFYTSGNDIGTKSADTGTTITYTGPTTMPSTNLITLKVTDDASPANYAYASVTLTN